MVVTQGVREVLFVGRIVWSGRGGGSEKRGRESLDVLNCASRT